VQIGKVAKDRVARVLKMRDGVLKHALLAIVQGGPTKINFKDKSAKVHLDAFEQRIDGLFFEHLFDAIGLEPEESESLWDALLLKEAKDVKKRAEGTLTIPISRRYKALAAGDRTFLDSSKKHKFYRPVPDTGAK
jgi:DNA polymerase/3'-5' exonuclease PolX